MKNYIFIVGVFFLNTSFAQDVNVERRKIEDSVHSIEDLQGVKFYRNGVEYNHKDAAKPLKLQR